MSPGEVERFETDLAGDPGGAAFPALAEAHRREGRASEAERVARAGLERRPDALAGRVALGLALLDLQRVDEARAELERVLNSVPDHPLALAGLEASDVTPARDPQAGAFDADLDGGELDAAFAQARPEEDEMVSTDSIAARAIRAAELDEPEDPDSDEDIVELEEEAALPVATHTVAGLLERQGHARDADAMRATLERDRVLATLERWLENLRRTAP